MSSEEFVLDDETLYQYEYIRRAGGCNMFDKTCVKRLANDFQFDELLGVIEDGDYAEILEAYDPERASALIDGDR